MKIQYLSIVFLCLFAISCNDNEFVDCAVEDPIKDLEWLKKEVGDIKNFGLSEYIYVTQAVYRNQWVFVFINCCQACTGSVKNCEGEVIAIFGDGKDNVSYNQLVDPKVIWKEANNECALY